MNDAKKVKAIYVNREYLHYESIKLRLDKAQNFSKKIRTEINKFRIRNSIALGYNFYAAVDIFDFWQQVSMGKLKNCISSTERNRTDRKASI